ncbi:Spy0128 family protein, partial [Streptococcus pyogenes]
NRYAPVAVKTSIDVEKTLTGRDLKVGEFEFVLKDEKGQILETASNQADGKVLFSEFTFTKSGDYRYTISEIKGNDPDIAYDLDEKVILFKVKHD